jgi:probable addiction module antidote protein
MKKRRIKTSELPEFDVSNYLNDETSIAEYLTMVVERNDLVLLAATLGDIAKARGMTEIAKSTGLDREALYKALRADAQPRFDTVSKVCAALGVKLVAARRSRSVIGSSADVTRNALAETTFNSESVSVGSIKFR